MSNISRFFRRNKPATNGSPAPPKTDLQQLAHMVLQALPEASGFILIAFPLDGSKPPRCVSNGNKESILKLLRDFVEKEGAKAD